MEGESSSRSNKGKSVRRSWTRKEEDALIVALKEIVAEGWKVDNAFRSGFLTVLEGKIKAAFTNTDLRATPHIESKIKNWKKSYYSLVTMLNTSGFGWNSTEKMIEVESDDVWEAYCKRDPNASHMRNRPFPFYDDWCLIFGRDRATGEFAEGPADLVDTVNADETDGGEQQDVNAGIEDMEFSGAASASQHESARSTDRRSAKKSRKDGLALAIGEFGDKLKTMFEKQDTRLEQFGHRVGYAQDMSVARKNVDEELRRLPITQEERIEAGLIITNDAQKVDYFSSLNDEDKVFLVRRLTRHS